MKNLRNRIILILAVLAVSIYMFYPLDQKINLGLDLRGGIHLVVRVMTFQAVEAEIDQLRERVEADLRDKSIGFSEVLRDDERTIIISGVSADQRAEVATYLDLYTANFSYRTVADEDLTEYRLSMLLAYENFLRNQAVRQARTVITRRIDQYGVAEPSISIYGSGEVKDQVIIELPGVDDFDRIKNLIEGAGKLELKLVHPTQGGPYPNEREALRAFNDFLPSDYEVVGYRDLDSDGNQTFLVIRKAAVITGSHLKNARRSEDSFTGRSEVLFFLNSEGVEIFSRTTEEHVGEQLAIVLDGLVYTAPNIQEKIASESARITGTFTIEEAEDIALVLRTGALPADLEFLENRTVGPSLGLDSIRKGLRASALGMVLIVASMLVIYRFSGLNAITCLLINLAILLGVLGYFGATLTLPGIAGMILTIGMAVDANILIFERIKEELRLGKTLRSAVEAGFARVFWTIIDTNVTTLVASLFLFQFGTGPIRGFAVTLAVGLLANIFTATFVSRTFFGLLLQRREMKQLSI